MAANVRLRGENAGDRATALHSRWRDLRRGQVWVAYLCLAPAFLALVIFTIIPFFQSLYFSLTKYNVLSAPEWRGLDNYRQLFESKYFWTSLGNTAYYTVATIPPKLILGLGLALLLNQKLHGVAFFRLFFYSPVVTAMVAVSVIWLWVYHPSSGLLNMALEAVGLPPQRWLLDPRLAMPSLMALGVWKYVGGTMVIYVAALQGIPQVYYEAASIDGAGRWQQLWHVTLPMLKPATFYNFVTMAISSFQVFEQMYIMTEGGPGYATTTVVYEIYREAFQKFHMGYASAMALTLFVIILLLTLLNFKVGASDIEY